ncbi:uncharacterized protein IL334_002252 [Kwoniella shivajii]|uniref:POT family proton-dependent oligopeptide transporter n=1 Tax=Kwoniella shivajii TaxID=564305 RepID=A0ABZ1CVG3_9TREE|nr:hypothetical protein IL334_002252 [Kwoniella shivajii]
MSNQAEIVQDLQAVPIAAAGLPAKQSTIKEKATDDPHYITTVGAGAGADIDEDLVPTHEELSTLRKVPAPLPWIGVLLCFIEFAERASYYGSKGPFNNFIKQPLPKGGNGAGAVAPGDAGLNQSAGALGLGSVDASALTNLFTFLAYVIPIYGGIVADTKWGRFKAICVGTAVGGFAHILLVIPAIPSVITHPNASLGTFIVSIIILAFAAGFIKPSLGPLLCDQIPVRTPTLKTLKTGERVIVDPGVTVERWLLIFYACINIGGFFAVATSYAERLVGFWLAYLLPGIVYFFMPIVLIFCHKRLHKAPPQGSVVIETWRVVKVLLANGGWRKMFKGGDNFWNKAKPSYIAEQNGTVDTQKVVWDDRFVDEVRQSFSACAVFMIIPIYVLADGGLGNSMNDMSVAMTLNGVPNDLISNWNPLAIIIATPLVTYGLYPWLARIGHPLKPMTRMFIGFMLGSLTCVISAIIQWRIYKTSPCGYNASTCDDVSPVSLWLQVPLYTLPAIGELFVFVTSYELAYTRSPARMKGLVYSIALFNQAIASALSLALADVVQDPNLIWPWVALAVACFLSAFLFPTYYKHLDEPVPDFADLDRQAGITHSTPATHRDQSHAVEDVERKY